MALLLAPRTSELRAALWSEFEHWREGAEQALWRVPAERMKMKDTHFVPLSRQACALLGDLHKCTGKQLYLFPSHGREGFMSNNTMLYGLYRLGFHGRTTTHGFRRLFSTEANEHGWDEDWIERQLAHDERDACAPLTTPRNIRRSGASCCNGGLIISTRCTRLNCKNAARTTRAKRCRLVTSVRPNEFRLADASCVK